MPVYKPGQLPKTGIAWVDAILRAVHEDPTGVGPSAFGVPMKILPKGPAARGLVQQLARRMPKLHKAAQKAPDVELHYPRTPEFSGAADYLYGRPYYSSLPEIRIASKEAISKFRGGPTDPVQSLVHELLHHLYAIKNYPGVVARRAPTKGSGFPIRSEKIAERYAHLAPKWLESSLAQQVGRGSPSYWGERAIEGMQALMESRVIPTARERATKETLRRILE